MVRFFTGHQSCVTVGCTLCAENGQCAALRFIEKLPSSRQRVYGLKSSWRAAEVTGSSDG